MSDELKREIDAITCESCAKGSHRDARMNHYNLDGDTGERYNFRKCESRADKLLPLFDSIAAKAFEMAAQAADTTISSTASPSEAI